MRNLAKKRFFDAIFVATALLGLSGLSACALYDGLSSSDSASTEDARSEDGVSPADSTSTQDARGEDTTPPEDARDLDAQPADSGDISNDISNDISGNNPADILNEPDIEAPIGEEPEVGFTEQTCFDVAECDALPGAHQCAELTCEEDAEGEKRCRISYKEAGTQCAEAAGVCDLPTLCTGESAYCAPKRYVGNGNHCCMPGANNSVVQGQCSGQVACKPAAPGEAGACGMLESEDLPSSYLDPDTEREVTFEALSFDGFDSRVLVVAPDETISFSIDFRWVNHGNIGWRVVFLFGIDGLFRKCLNTSATHGQYGDYNPGPFENVTITAPQQEGIYYLNSRVSLGDNCNETRNGNAFNPRLTDSTLAVIRVVSP